jgi:hypothetical protein
MKLKMQNPLKMLSIALMAIGLLGQMWTLAAWNRYAKELPRFPDAKSGRVYRLDLHGLLVYQTAREHSIFWGIENWSWMIFCVGIVLGLVVQWRSGELRKYFGGNINRAS